MHKLRSLRIYLSFFITQQRKKHDAEARFYIQAAQTLTFKSTVMVNDFEDSKMLQISTMYSSVG